MSSIPSPELGDQIVNISLRLFKNKTFIKWYHMVSSYFNFNGREHGYAVCVQPNSKKKNMWNLRWWFGKYFIDLTASDAESLAKKFRITTMPSVILSLPIPQRPYNHRIPDGYSHRVPLWNISEARTIARQVIQMKISGFRRPIMVWSLRVAFLSD